MHPLNPFANFDGRPVAKHIEEPNTDALKRALWFTPSLSKTNKIKETMNYLEKVALHNGSLPVHYYDSELGALLAAEKRKNAAEDEQKESYYRIYARDDSWTNLSRQFRKAAQHGKVLALDIANCNYVITSDQFPENEFQKEYVENRERYIKAAMDHYGLTRELAKDLFLRLLFLGTEEKFRKGKIGLYSMTTAKTALDLAKGLEEDAKKVAEHTTNKFETEYKIIRKYHRENDMRKKNATGTLVSYEVNQIRERECIDALKEEFGERVCGSLHDEVNVVLGTSDQEDEEAATRVVQTMFPQMQIKAEKAEEPAWSRGKIIPYEKAATFELKWVDTIMSMYDQLGIQYSTKTQKGTKIRTIGINWSTKTHRASALSESPLNLSRDGVAQDVAVAHKEAVRHGGTWEERNELEYMLYCSKMLPQFHLVNYMNKFFVECSSGDQPCIYTLKYNDKLELDDYDMKTVAEFTKSLMTQIKMCKPTPAAGLLKSDKGDLSHKWHEYNEKETALGYMWQQSLHKRMTKGLGIFFPGEKVPPGWINVYNGLSVDGLWVEAVEQTSAPGILALKYRKAFDRWINVFGGCTSTPTHAPLDVQLQQVLKNRKLIYDHKRLILCSGNDEFFQYYQNWCGSLLQFQGKLRVMLVIFSVYQQIGKGIIWDQDGLFELIIGTKYFYKSSAKIDDNTGLLGQFNWDHRGRLLIYIDEGGLFVHAKNTQGTLKRYLSTPNWEYGKKGVQPVMMRDKASIVQTTNDPNICKAEDGGSRAAIIQAADTYSVKYAEAGTEVMIDGQKVNMTPEIRKAYFKALGDAIKDPLTQRAVLYDYQKMDLSNFDIQKIPVTELRRQLQGLTECTVLQFVKAWVRDDLSYIDPNEKYDKEQHLRAAPENGSQRVTYLWNIYNMWAKSNYLHLERTMSERKFSMLLSQYAKLPHNLLVKTQGTSGKDKGCILYEPNPDKMNDDSDDDASDFFNRKRKRCEGAAVGRAAAQAQGMDQSEDEDATIEVTQNTPAA